MTFADFHTICINVWRYARDREIRFRLVPYSDGWVLRLEAFKTLKCSVKWEAKISNERINTDTVSNVVRDIEQGLLNIAEEIARIEASPDYAKRREKAKRRFYPRTPN